MKNKLLSLMLALIMMLGLLPISAFAANAEVNVSNQTELNTAISNATAQTKIVLADGTYNLLVKNSTCPNMVDKDLVFSGSKNAVFDLTGIVGATWHTQDTGATITFQGVTVKWNEDNEGYQGFTNAEKIVYQDCTIYGTQFMGGDADFINCVFEAENTAEKGYAVYGRGAGTLTFTNCTFKTDGRAIMLFQDQTTEVNVVMSSCVFYDNGNYSSKDKAVVETGNGSYGTSKFNLSFTDCTVHGFEANNSNSPLWGNKDNMDFSDLEVIIDEVNVSAPHIDMSDIALEGKEYDGLPLAYTGEAKVVDYLGEEFLIGEEPLPLVYQWFEKDGDNYIPLEEAPKDPGLYALVVKLAENVELPGNAELTCGEIEVEITARPRIEPVLPFIVTGVTQVKTIDAETEAALEGATFELYRISSTGSRKLHGTYTSNATGRITARTLSSRFTYELVMTAAPEGYDLLETPIIFRVQYNRPLQQVVPVTKTVVEETPVEVEPAA